MRKLILENEALIEKFNIDKYLEQKNFPVAAALSALEATNEVQKNYFLTEKTCEENSENILRLYALLQALFVSIDSLYSLAYSFTRSKNFININLNPQMRELKYIRNDVVGHPSNRIYHHETIAFCILDTKSIGQNEFRYHIYTADETIEKQVDLRELAYNYYVECNRYLNRLYEIAYHKNEENQAISSMLKVLDLYRFQKDYHAELAQFQKVYSECFPQTDASGNRIFWRLRLIDRLKNYSARNADEADLKEYCIGLELIKIFELLAQQKCEGMTERKKPYLVVSFYRFLKKNRIDKNLLIPVHDSKHPTIEVTLNYLTDLAKKKKAEGPLRYLTLLKELLEQKQEELLYAFALPIKEYQKK